MTPKDYVAIAAIFERSNRSALFTGSAAVSMDAVTDGVCNWKHTAKRHAADIATDIANVMARDNPRFDRERFLKACGVQA